MKIRDIITMPTVKTEPVFVEENLGVFLHDAIAYFAKEASPSLDEDFRWRINPDDTLPDGRTLEDAARSFAVALKAKALIGDNRPWGDEVFLIQSVLEVDGAPAVVASWISGQGDRHEFTPYVVDADLAMRIVRWAEDAVRPVLPIKQVDDDVDDYHCHLDWRLTASGFQPTGWERLSYVLIDPTMQGCEFARLGDGSLAVSHYENGMTTFAAEDVNAAIEFFFSEARKAAADFRTIGQNYPCMLFGYATSHDGFEDMTTVVKHVAPENRLREDEDASFTLVVGKNDDPYDKYDCNLDTAYEKFFSHLEQEITRRYATMTAPTP